MDTIIFASLAVAVTALLLAITVLAIATFDCVKPNTRMFRAIGVIANVLTKIFWGGFIVFSITGLANFMV